MNNNEARHDSSDPFTGIHWRLDQINQSLHEVAGAQADTAKKTVELDHRVNMLEKDVEHGRETISMTFGAIQGANKENREAINKVHATLVEHVKEENDNQRKMFIWLKTTIIGLALAGLFALAQQGLKV